MKQTLIVLSVVAAAAAVGYVTVILRPAADAVPVGVESSLATSSSGLAQTGAPVLSRDEAYVAFTAPHRIISTKEGGEKFLAAIDVLATKSPDMTFMGCEPNPLVISVERNGPLYLRNAGTSTISVRISPSFTYSVTPGETVDASSSVKGSVSMATVSCMGRGPVGAVSISR